MAAENQLKRSEERIEFRIGINLGDIIVDGNDIAGDGVNVAARLEALAEPGGICVSAAVREQVHGSLDVSFNDIGDQRVKNIMRPIRVFAVGLDAARASDPTTRQSNTRREARETDSSGFALDKSVHRRFLLVAALAALTAVGALLLWWNWQRPRAPEPPALSVGVLPLVAPSGTPAATQRLASLTRDISAILARTDVSIRILPVTLRQSSEVNHDDIGELARPIQVRYLLEGEVQLGPEATEIRLRLVKGASGEQVWNETVSLKEPAAVADQNRGLRRVMEHLQARLFEVEMQRVTAAGGFRTTPMDDALRALALDKTQKSLDRLRRQEAMYEEALRRDPDLVPALLGVFHALDGQIDVDSNVASVILMFRVILREVKNRD